MSAIKRILVIPAALVAMVFMSANLSAQCDSCAAYGGGASAAGSFGYPGSCQSCGSRGGGSLGGAIHNFQAGVETYKADYRINRARASAWPQPFSCWDREHYHTIFNQQFSVGNQIAHTLTSEYFNPESNELNRAGELRVGWIMQNAPQNDKQIYVYEDETGPTIDQRMASIREFTGRYYAHMGNASIAKSQLLPNQIPASFQQSVLQAYAEATPDPVIPVDVGSTINATVGN